MSIVLKNISKSFGQAKALNDINFTFRDGETSILIGPSGCGKSTLIRIITGLIKSDTGNVIIDDEELSGKNISELRKKFGYVIQEGGLFPHLTAKGNVSLLAEYLGWDKHRIANRIEELTELTKLAPEILNQYPSQLSGGQRQRVSIIRALMTDPEILLLDEPLGALDPLIRFDLQTDLKEIFTRLRKTVVMVTHDMGEASYFGDKILLMKNGSVVQVGKTEDFVKNPAGSFVTKFINAQRKPLFNSESEG